MGRVSLCFFADVASLHSTCLAWRGGSHPLVNALLTPQTLPLASSPGVVLIKWPVSTLAAIASCFTEAIGHLASVGEPTPQDSGFTLPKVEEVDTCRFEDYAWRVSYHLVRYRAALVQLSTCLNVSGIAW